MRRWCVVGGMLIGLLSSGAAAQEKPALEQLKKQYEDGLKQLQIANNRKNELAGENEQLKARLAAVEKQLAEKSAQLGQLEVEAAQWSEKTFALRSLQAAWQRFLGTDPRLKARWELFLAAAVPQDLADWNLPLEKQDTGNRK